jgi:release factor glutamine methyltransferase
VQISAALAWGSRELKTTSDTAPLDAELLLADLLHCSRAYLMAYGERSLSKSEAERFAQFIERRRQGEPLAYIVGHKEFWSLDLLVTPATLIPRPETELLVELVLRFFPKDHSIRRLADLGTGSGALALAFSQERPLWEVYATDQSAAALEVAKQNAVALGKQNLQFFQGRWCEALPSLSFDAIVSNPPYLSESEWEVCQKDLNYEPLSALVSGKNGLQDIQEIIQGAKKYLRSGAYLLLEHGSTQALEVRALFLKENYTEIASYHDLAGRERVTVGRWTI